MKQSVLIVDDEMSISTSLEYALEDEYRVQSCQSPNQALRLMEQNPFDLCLMDLKIGRHNGIELLKQIKGAYPQTAIIMMTAYGSIETSVEAMRHGAFTYLTKPLNIQELHLVLAQALEHQQLGRKVEYLAHQLADKFFYNGMIAKSSSMLEVFKMVEKLKDVDTSVLITGESGTGKELVAKALHFAGVRRAEHFEAVNCAAIPEGLLESELFGHVQGAFTGASTNRVGKLAHASNGTLYLDEIGDMPLPLQAKILRVIQEKTFCAVGSNKAQKLNARIISATNKDLRQMVEQGLFREDLFFRLNVVEISLPPLRRRKRDIPLLTDHYIHCYNESLHKHVEGISAEARQKLLTYHFPGNVRELINILEYAMVLCEGDVLTLGDFPPKIREGVPFKPGAGQDDLAGLPLKEVEKRAIAASLALNNGNRAATARTLQISEKGLRNKIAEYGLT